MTPELKTINDNSDNSNNITSSSQNDDNEIYSDPETNTSTETDAVNKFSTKSNTVELSETFYVNNKRKNNFEIYVSLSSAGIRFRRNKSDATEQDEEERTNNEQFIQIDDIIGSYCGQQLKKHPRGGLSSCRKAGERAKNSTTTTTTKNSESSTAKDNSAFLYIYAYEKNLKTDFRKRTARILCFCSFQYYEENLTVARKWQKQIKMFKSTKLSDEELINYDSEKEMLILLNPKSGSGKGRDLFQKQVAPILKEADVQYDLQITTRANFARDLMRTRDDLLTRYKGVIVASGDGLFYEVLNGIMERADWRDIILKLPIGIIPCGSGNGLAKSIAHLYNEPYEPQPILNAALNCVSGKSALMDIVKIELSVPGKEEKPLKMFSFLSVGWGLIADIDIESERWRAIGSQRFTLWSIHRLISLRTYKGKLSYLPISATTETSASDKNEAASLSCDKESQTEEIYFDLDEQSPDDDTESLSDTKKIPHNESWLSLTSGRTAYYSVAGLSMRSRRSASSKTDKANEKLACPVPTSNLPPLNAAIPSETWHSEQGSYVMVHAAYTSHLSAECFFVPESRLNDGIIYLVVIRAGVSRSQLLQFLLGMSHGTHIPKEPNEHIKVIPVKAFRIEPQDSDGIIAVDGELVDYGPIQGEILPGMIKVMVPTNK